MTPIICLPICNSLTYSHISIVATLRVEPRLLLLECILEEFFVLIPQGLRFSKNKLVKCEIYSVYPVSWGNVTLWMFFHPGMRGLRVASNPYMYKTCATATENNNKKIIICFMYATQSYAGFFSSVWCLRNWQNSQLIAPTTRLRN